MKRCGSGGHCVDETELEHELTMLAALCDWLRTDVSGLLATNRITFFATGTDDPLQLVPVKAELCVCGGGFDTVGGVPACS